ncbi:hypothetical protein ACLB2K_051023 [Fragaria x ananassa]
MRGNIVRACVGGLDRKGRSQDRYGSDLGIDGGGKHGRHRGCFLVFGEDDLGYQGWIWLHPPLLWSCRDLMKLERPLSWGDVCPPHPDERAALLRPPHQVQRPVHAGAQGRRGPGGPWDLQGPRGKGRPGVPPQVGDPHRAQNLVPTTKAPNVLCCDSFSSTEESGNAICLCYLAHLPARLEIDSGWIVVGEGRCLLACTGVGGGGQWRRSGKVVTGYMGNSGDRSPAVGEIQVTGVRMPVTGVRRRVTGVRVEDRNPTHPNPPHLTSTNPKLWGPPLPNKCQAIKGIDDLDVDNNNEHETAWLLSSSPWFYVPAGIGFIVGFWGVHVCWQGINCDAAGWVTRISLPSDGLTLKQGITFPSSKLALENLTHLTHLNLSQNSLNQSVASFLSLTHLEVLDLSSNLLSGELPVLSLSSSIRVLDLSNNQFTGPIPSQFFRQAWSLTSFRISNNLFSGSIPSSLCLHSSPLILDFSINRFNGSLSSGLGECSKLKVFRAGYNNLSGSLPEEIYKAAKLEEVAMPRNSLVGVISDRILNLTNLAVLDLSVNQLSGVLPLNFGNLAKLKFLLLHWNNIGGSLPPSLMNCTNLIELNLLGNEFHGDISMLNFSKLSQLARLDLFSNNLNGSFPTSLYSCKSLKAVRLGLNDIQGEIQPEILSLKSLSFLSLSYSRLSNITKAMNILRHSKSLIFLTLAFSYEADEESPADFGIADIDGFQRLRFLSLGGCNLVGEIPAWLSKLKNLAVLSFYENKLTGPVPSQLGTLPRLFYLHLGSNRIVGEFPKQLLRLPMLGSESNQTADSDAHLELPVITYPHRGTGQQYNSLSFFPRGICLGNNNFYGSIPTEIGRLDRLQNLELNHNNFTGNIPAQISNLRDLQTLDISENHLSGQIPSSVTSLNFLANLNVSYNNLEGQIPKGTQIQGFNVSSFEGNPNLCGLPLPNECPTIKGIESTDDLDVDNNNKHQTAWVSVPVGLGFTVGFLGVCCSLIFNQTWRYAYFRFTEKEYSISSRRNPVVRRRGQRSLRRPERDEKVIRDEYEVEIGSKKTYEDNYPKSQKPQGVVKGSKGEGQPRASNIGDFFQKGL